MLEREKNKELDKEELVKIEKGGSNRKLGLHILNNSLKHCEILGIFCDDFETALTEKSFCRYRRKVSKFRGEPYQHLEGTDSDSNSDVDSDSSSQDSSHGKDV